jgi:hypothetical protein
MMRISSSSDWGLALRDEDGGKRAGSDIEPENSSASDAARGKKHLSVETARHVGTGPA